MGTENTNAEEMMKQYAIRLGFVVDQNQVNNSLNPTLTAIEKKLDNLRKASEVKSGIFGKDFMEEKIKSLTGLDTTMFKATHNMLKFGLASKDLNADNKELYNSLNPIGKSLVDLASKWNKKSIEEEKARKAAEATIQGVNDLDAVLADTSALQARLDSGDITSEQFAELSANAQAAAGATGQLTPAIEGSTVAMEGFVSVSTLGLAAVVFAVVGVSKAIYKMFMASVQGRDEIKKFDKLIGGMGSEGVAAYDTKLQSLNKELWTLGMSMEAVNEVAFKSMEQGLAANRSFNAAMIGNILEVGSFGIVGNEVNQLYTELLKTTTITTESILAMNDGFLAWNQSVHKSTSLGQLSFEKFREAITSSSQALAIATSKGKSFTDSMTKDLTALAGLAHTVSISITELNQKFDEASSLINSKDSGFRTLLTMSGGASIDQMLTNTFDKTEATLKAVTYLKDFNKSFGGNMQLTAQVAESLFGMSRDTSLKMMNMRQEAIDEMRKSQLEIATLQSDVTRKAYEDVNNDLSSLWGRVKMMFSTFFQNAFGHSSGMRMLVDKVTSIVSRLKEAIQSAKWVKDFEAMIDKVADWVGTNLTRLITWLEDILVEFGEESTKNPIVALWDLLIEVLKGQLTVMGELLGSGIAKAILLAPFSLIKAVGDWFFLGDDLGQNSVSNRKGGKESPLLAAVKSSQSVDSTRKSEINAEKGDLSKWSPDAVTYGKMKDDKGNSYVGYMTIAQKQYELEQEKKEIDARNQVTQEAIKASGEQQVVLLTKIAQERGIVVQKADTVAPYTPMGSIPMATMALK